MWCGEDGGCEDGIEIGINEMTVEMQWCHNSPSAVLDVTTQAEVSQMEKSLIDLLQPA